MFPIPHLLDQVKLNHLRGFDAHHHIYTHYIQYRCLRGQDV